MKNRSVFVDVEKKSLTSQYRRLFIIIIIGYGEGIRERSMTAHFLRQKNPLSPCYVMVFEQTLKTVRVRRFELLFLNHFLFLFDNKERKLAANIVMISIHIFLYLP